MNLDAYLARIGLSHRPPATLGGLTAIHRAHLTAISYENIDVQLGRTVTIERPAIYDKIVGRRRGGWCYEMNGILGWALGKLGFKVTRVTGAVMRAAAGDAKNGNHLVLRVELPEGIFLADVGFGDGPRDPIRIVPGPFTSHGFAFELSRQGGDWWRLVASLFLHFGMLHLSMNMLAMWVLGPFVELALGFRRFILVYLLAGIGSMVMVMAVGSGPRGEQMTVGASGCIMGLVGATGGLMLRGWLREKSRSARGRLLAMVMIVATQTMFDSLVPQVSMTGHLSGAMLGLALTLLVRDRLQPVTPGAKPRQAAPTTT